VVIVLVLLVVFLFLQSFRATLVPLIAVPISLIGTFAGMAALDFSINTLTLFGMVLAIGIVVDDAIVVVENVERLMHDEKLSPKDAARKAMDEVTGPVIAIVLVLVSVFVPVAFLGGMTGELYKQFAVTIAVSVVLSGIVALTLSPALGGVLLKPAHSEKGRFFSAFNRFFDWATARYTEGVKRVLRRSALFGAIFVALFLSVIGLFNRVPGGFVPAEDQGYIMLSVQLPEGSSLIRTKAATEQVEAVVKANPAVKDIISFVGFDLVAGQNKSRVASLFVILKDWSERPTRQLHAFAVLKQLSVQLRELKTANVIGFNPPTIPGLSATGGFELYIQSRGESDTHRLNEVAQEFLVKARKRSEFAGIVTTLRANSPELFVDVDREKAKSLGVNLTDIFQTIQATFGSLYVNDFNKFGRVYRVQLQAEPQYRASPEDIGRLFVRNRENKMLPLSTVVTLRNSSGPEALDRFNGFPSAKIMGNPAPGVSSGQAMAALEELAAELPPGFSYAFAGEYFSRKKQVEALHRYLYLVL
jgi:hydrophobe/amphiphile efflux-1 (HAE1) family protein